MRIILLFKYLKLTTFLNVCLLSKPDKMFLLTTCLHGAI